MARAPFQVLVLPYRIISKDEIHYALFKREPKRGAYWQGIAGGGENGESHLEAAQRESFEEAGINPSNEFIKLDCCTMIPVINIGGFIWGEDRLVIPEYYFGVHLDYEQLKLSGEHTEYKWVDYNTALEQLYWDSNKVALWELNYRVNRVLQRTH